MAVEILKSVEVLLKENLVSLEFWKLHVQYTNLSLSLSLSDDDITSRTLIIIILLFIIIIVY